MTRNIKLVQAAASFALTGTGGSCSAVVDLVSVLKGLSIVLRVGVPGLDLIVRPTRTVLLCSGEDSLFLYTVFLPFWAIPSGTLPLIRAYSYTEGLYIGNKYYA